MDVTVEILIEGSAFGPLLVLEAPISFWGGVDPKTGIIVDVRHPQCGERITETILFLPGIKGSSSSSSIFLELIYGGKAPAGLLMRECDAILLLGSVVATEMGYQAPPAFKLPTDMSIECDDYESARLYGPGQVRFFNRNK